MNDLVCARAGAGRENDIVCARAGTGRVSDPASGRARSSASGRRRVVAPLAVALLSALLPAPFGPFWGFSSEAMAQEPVESIVAVVDEEPVLLSEVQAQLEMAIQTMGIDRTDEAQVAELREQILDQQIDQLVLYREALAQEIPVDQGEVIQAVDEAIARNKQEIGSEEAFQRQLKLEGLTEDELRERYIRQARMEMMIGRLMQRDLGGDIAVSDDEVRAYYEANRADLPKRDTALHLQHIVIAVQPDSVLLAKAQSLALDVAEQIRLGKLSFAEAAKRYSDDPNGRTGGDLRRLRRGDLTGSMGPQFEETVFGVPEGEVSEPMPSPLGFHLVKMHAKDPGGEWVHPSHILFRVPIVQADIARAEERAEMVYERALAGEPFDELARRYSDEPESAARGGDLGWVPQGGMSGLAAERLPQLEEREITTPIQTEGFFHIFRLVEREDERDFAYEEVAGELADLVRAQKREGRYEEWVAEIKQRHHIERFPWGED